MILTRRTALGLFAAAGPGLALTAPPAFAREPNVFQNAGSAINGIDAVGYFNAAAPLPGSAEHSVDWDGVTWLFSTARNASSFRADPMAFAPVFGGYCAYAASLGYLAPTKPEAWTVHENRLYLNASLRARDLWLQDIPGNIAKGKANWPGILG